MEEHPEPRELDLHGLRPEMALRKLQQALHSSRILGEPELLVICGRGWGNLEQKPVLRGHLEGWLGTESAQRAGVRGWHLTAKGGALLLNLG